MYASRGSLRQVDRHILQIRQILRVVIVAMDVEILITLHIQKGYQLQSTQCEWLIIIITAQ